MALTALLAGAGVSTAGGGLPLADPTRPPLAAAVVVVPAAAKATTALRATPPPALPPPHVQALKLPQSGGASALVDGYWVNVGDLLQGRRVLAIDAAGLLWQGAVGDQRVPLLGGTPKQAPGSIVLNRSAGYVPSATPDSSAKGLAGGTPGMAPGTGTAATPDGGPGPGQDKEQPLSVARRNSR